MDYDLIVQMLAAKFGVSPSEALAVLGTLMLGFRILGKVIPDDKRGVAGFIRKASKILGAYVENKKKSAPDVEDNSLSFAEEYRLTLEEQPVQTAQNFFARDANGRFTKRV